MKRSLNKITAEFSSRDAEPIKGDANFPPAGSLPFDGPKATSVPPHLSAAVTRIMDVIRLALTYESFAADGGFFEFVMEPMHHYVYIPHWQNALKPTVFQAEMFPMDEVFVQVESDDWHSVKVTQQTVSATMFRHRYATGGGGTSPTRRMRGRYWPEICTVWVHT